MPAEKTTCPGCHTVLPKTDYPADNRYGVLSAECRQMFDDIILKEEEFGHSVHRLIVDAYGVQHPPHADVQEQLHISPRFIAASIQSVAIHLIALYCAFEKKIELGKIAPIMSRVLATIDKQKSSFENLLPPADLGNIRATDVRNKLYAKDAQEISLGQYEQIIWDWAQSAWFAWKPYHAKVKLWHDQYTK